MGVLEDCLREDLNERAERRVAVLDPVKLVIDNYPEDREEESLAPNHPQKPEAGRRALPLARELWIERDDYQENPPKGYFRLAPGAEVRLRYGYIVKCTGAERDAQGNVVAVHCTYDPATKSGTPGAEGRKVKGNIHWLAVNHAHAAEVRLYDRLFSVPQPGSSASMSAPAPIGASATSNDAGLEDTAPFDEPTERNYLDDLNLQSRRVVTAYVERSLAQSAREERFQFERHGYFIADARDHDAAHPVFNRAVTLRDSWSKDSPGKPR
jgi:glutaminyl-tRNA synthetase